MLWWVAKRRWTNAINLPSRLVAALSNSNNVTIQPLLLCPHHLYYKMRRSENTEDKLRRSDITNYKMERPTTADDKSTCQSWVWSCTPLSPPRRRPRHSWTRSSPWSANIRGDRIIFVAFYPEWSEIKTIATSFFFSSSGSSRLTAKMVSLKMFYQILQWGIKCHYFVIVIIIILISLERGHRWRHQLYTFLP